MLRIFALVVGGLVIAVVVALGAMLAFGTSKPAPPLASVSDPFKSVDFRDLPAVETIPAHHGSPIAFRVWRENPPMSDPALVVIAIHGSSGSSSSLHPLAKALSAQGIAVYAPDIRGHGRTGVRGDIDYAGQLDDDLADFVAARSRPDIRMRSWFCSASRPAVAMPCMRQPRRSENPSRGQCCCRRCSARACRPTGRRKRGPRLTSRGSLRSLCSIASAFTPSTISRRWPLPSTRNAPISSPTAIRGC